MVTFNWLHLSDLHVGLGAQAWMLDRVRQEFFRDLGAVHESAGPFDAVLFTGDLVQSGSAEQFLQLDEFLRALAQRLGELGSRPRLLAVPGNHDLERPADANDAAVDAMLDWPRATRVHDRFWAARASPYRDVVGRAFKNFLDWQARGAHGFERCDDYFRGALPGDFLAVLEKQGERLAVAGLNGAFVHLSDAVREGQLALHTSQFLALFEAAGGGPRGASWLEANCDAALLMTHHPPAWFDGESREQHLLANIHAPGRFVAHLFGHMHRGEARGAGALGQAQRRFVQGASLFGLERAPDGKLERRHGYLTGRLALGAEGGALRLFPREMVLTHDQDFQFVSDVRFGRLERDGGTAPEPVGRLRPPRHAPSVPPPSSRAPSVPPPSSRAPSAPPASSRAPAFPARAPTPMPFASPARPPTPQPFPARAPTPAPFASPARVPSPPPSPSSGRVLSVPPSPASSGRWSLAEPYEAEYAAEGWQPQAPGGGYDPAWYVPRDREERIALNNLSLRGSPALVVWGPTQFGKTTFVKRVLDRLNAAPAPGARAVTVSLSTFGEALDSEEDFFREFGRRVSLQTGQPPPRWAPGAARDGLEALVKAALRARLKEGGPLVLVIEGVGHLAHCEFRDSVFEMFRFWIQDVAEEPWHALRLVVVTAHTPMAYHRGATYSPFFNAALQIEISDFSADQTRRLAELYRVDWPDERQAAVRDVVGGHPFLLRLMLHEMALNGTPVEALCDPGSPEGAEFRRRAAGLLPRLDQKHCAALARVLDDPRAAIDVDIYYTLRGAGLLTHGPEGYQFRCNLYREFVAEGLPGAWKP
ncbi:MAG TPA: AAA-like domain-containing protein [Polyangiaceae bacterium]|nr:AAA-like domain-containing protein [Polyangiaceae bacterium]